MNENALEGENISKPSPTAKPKGSRKAGRKAKRTKKTGRTKAAAKPKADRANKKAEVIEMMKRAKGATLPEITKATGWQPHTVPCSILSSSLPKMTVLGGLVFMGAKVNFLNQVRRFSIFLSPGDSEKWVAGVFF